MASLKVYDFDKLLIDDENRCINTVLKTGSFVSISTIYGEDYEGKLLDVTPLCFTILTKEDGAVEFDYEDVVMINNQSVYTEIDPEVFYMEQELEREREFLDYDDYDE